MHNFKVGDKVVRKAHHNNDIFLHYVGPAPYVVTAVSTDGYFLGINNWGDSGGDRCPWSRSNFTLVAEQDDPLPPAPESVLYLKDDGQRKLIASMYHSSVGIKIHLEYPSIVKCLGYSMEPDAALQLAHDLRRMAMEIKRKEK